jgi:hypothetical protein
VGGRVLAKLLYWSSFGSNATDVFQIKKTITTRYSRKFGLAMTSVVSVAVFRRDIGFSTQLESLILAQDERWRQA